MAEKSLITTYFLWAFGGIFGLHHFYLRRDIQALIWWMFPGGYFGLGYIRDLWQIPEYVNDANEERSYIEQLTEQMRKHEKPPSSWFRSLGQILLADSLGYLMLSAIPYELFEENSFLIPILKGLTAPLGVAIGIYLVSNIGRHEGTFKSALFGAYLVLPAYYFLDTPVGLTSIGSSYTIHKQWRRTPRSPKSLWKRMGILVLCGSLYLFLWGSFLYFNCSVEQETGTVKCRDAAKHFFKSPVWLDFVTVMRRMLGTVQHEGWRESWRRVVEAFDPTGKTNALRVLGLDDAATQQEITSRYRLLSREWHPDKNRHQKEEAESKFIEIQQAYEILSTIKSQRAAQNTQHASEKEE